MCKRCLFPQQSGRRIPRLRPTLWTVCARLYCNPRTLAHNRYTQKNPKPTDCYAHDSLEILPIKTIISQGEGLTVILEGSRTWGSKHPG